MIHCSIRTIQVPCIRRYLYRFFTRMVHNEESRHLMHVRLSTWHVLTSRVSDPFAHQKMAPTVDQ